MRKIIFLVLMIIIAACSSTEKATKNEPSSGNEPYVFDEIKTLPEKEENTGKDTSSVSEIDKNISQDKLKNKDEDIQLPETITNENTEEETEQPLYFIQIGAFKTQEAAENFIKEAKELLGEKEFGITFNDEVELFVVQLPPFTNRKEAEKVRNRLWKYDKFKDAFIVTQK